MNFNIDISQIQEFLVDISMAEILDDDRERLVNEAKRFIRQYTTMRQRAIDKDKAWLTAVHEQAQRLLAEGRLEWENMELDEPPNGDYEDYLLDDINEFAMADLNELLKAVDEHYG